MKQKNKIRIGVLISVRSASGKVSNAGNFLICERAKELLKSFFGDDFEFVYIERDNPFDDNFDGLIILGGPLITQKLHKQSKSIFKSIQNRNIPIFCLGLGVSYDTYSLDDESIRFWKHVYATSKLFSVRDKVTKNFLKKYGIEAELTGCPALFNLKNLKKNVAFAKKGTIKKIAVTIPSLPIASFSSIKNLLLTLYFLFILKKKFNKKMQFGVIFQHGCNQFTTKLVWKMASMFGMKTYDLIGKNLDSPQIRKYDICIGPRLHSHIFFLSLNKPSFLLDIDRRTEGFLKTIKTPNETYTFSGVKNLVNLLSNRIAENNFDEFKDVPNDISRLYIVMKFFLKKISLFY